MPSTSYAVNTGGILNPRRGPADHFHAPCGLALPPGLDDLQVAGVRLGLALDCGGALRITTTDGPVEITAPVRPALRVLCGQPGVLATLTPTARMGGRIRVVRVGPAGRRVDQATGALLFCEPARVRISATASSSVPTM